MSLEVNVIDDKSGMGEGKEKDSFSCIHFLELPGHEIRMGMEVWNRYVAAKMEVVLRGWWEGIQ